MNKIWKWFIGILLFLTLMIFVFVIIENQAVAYLPFRMISMYDYPLIGGFVSYFLFWGSVVCAIIVLVLLLAIIFYPSTKQSLTLDSGDGTLKIEKKAIEQFVLQIVKREPFISDPSVKAKLFKKTVKVKISGEMRKAAVLDQHKKLVEEVQAELKSLLGTTDKIKIKVVLDNYQSSKLASDTNRVE